MKKIFIFISIISGLTILSACQSSEKISSGGEKESISLGGSWAGTMHSMRGSFQTLTPYIYNTAEFQNSANEDVIKKELQNLNREASRMNHDPSLISRDPTVHFVSVSFQEDVQRIDQAFKEGQKPFARYQLMRLTSYCVDCHTRTQQGKEFHFVNISAFPKAMSAENKIEVLIASRNYDKAFDESLRAVRVDAPYLDLEKVAVLGLQIAVQYKDSKDLAQQLVKELQKNKNLAYYLKAKSQAWENSISRWTKESSKSDGLLIARKILKQKNTTEIEAMRALHFLLPRLTQESTKEELGEALYLAGVSYEMLGEVADSYLNENYYESCIVRVPHSAWAQSCFKKLENSITIGYSGSSGIHIPVEVQVKLNKLKELTSL